MKRDATQYNISVKPLHIMRKQLLVAPSKLLWNGHSIARAYMLKKNMDFEDFICTYVGKAIWK